MRIIRECISNWNNYPTYSSHISDTNQELSKWHNQTWQGWINVETDGSDFNRQLPCFKPLKISKYNIFKDFGDEVILWNTSSGAVVILAKDEYDALRNYSKSLELRRNDDSSSIVSELFRMGFLVDTEEIESLKLDLIRHHLSSHCSAIKNFIILPTTACNGRCFYCFAHNDIAKIKTMDTAIVQQVIKFICQTASPGDDIVLRWFGGEPLLSMNIIDNIISGIRCIKGPEIPIFSIITSNGSLLSEQVIINAKEVWNVKKFHITIDGYQEEHQLRKNYTNTENGKYENVIGNISLLLKHGIYTIVRINLDKTNISSLERILDDLEMFRNNPLFFVHATNLQPINKHGNIENFYCEDELGLFYYNVYDTLFRRGFYKNIEILLPNRLTSLCTAAMPNYYLINPDGDIFKCDKEEHVKINSIGNCDCGIIQNSNLLKWIDTSLDRVCADCNFLPVCHGGCKYYRYNSDKCGVSPCVKLRYTIDYNLKLAYKYFGSANLNNNEKS